MVSSSAHATRYRAHSVRCSPQGIPPTRTQRSIPQVTLEVAPTLREQRAIGPLAKGRNASDTAHRRPMAPHRLSRSRATAGAHPTNRVESAQTCVSDHGRQLQPPFAPRPAHRSGKSLRTVMSFRFPSIRFSCLFVIRRFADTSCNRCARREHECCRRRRRAKRVARRGYCIQAEAAQFCGDGLEKAILGVQPRFCTCRAVGTACSRESQRGDACTHL